MSDSAFYRQIAEGLLEQGNRSAAEAMDTLLTNYSQAATSAHETRQQVVKQRKRIDELEAQLQMVQGIRYQEMRLELPEGGHVSLRWPGSMTAESADMLREVFELQMKAHARYMMNRATPTADDAAARPASGETET